MLHGLTDPRLLEILVDPISKVPLRYDSDHQELICDSGRRAYPIRDGIPILLVSDARLINEDEIKKP
ncbi:MAG: Trm112 family protein [Alphaproteobacteria bacterium]|nr:Trm112 family protein [Alphaproteobacteria bacterium]